MFNVIPHRRYLHKSFHISKCFKKLFSFKELLFLRALIKLVLQKVEHRACVLGRGRVIERHWERWLRGGGGQT